MSDRGITIVHVTRAGGLMESYGPFVDYSEAILEQNYHMAIHAGDIVEIEQLKKPLSGWAAVVINQTRTVA